MRIGSGFHNMQPLILIQPITRTRRRFKVISISLHELLQWQRGNPPQTDVLSPRLEHFILVDGRLVPIHIQFEWGRTLGHRLLSRRVGKGHAGVRY